MGTLAVVSQILLALAGIFLMIVVLLQRGRGGGLAGAFGGLGGQSAFGTKAGDVFTRITIVIAIIWVALAGGSGYFLRASSSEKGTESFQGNVPEDEGAGALPGDEELEFPQAPALPELETTPPADESATPAGEGTIPEGTVPESTTSGGTAPEGTTPEGATPEGTAPGGETSEGTAPEATTPEGATSEGAASQGPTDGSDGESETPASSTDSPTEE